MFVIYKNAIFQEKADSTDQQQNIALFMLFESPFGGYLVERL